MNQNLRKAPYLRKENAISVAATVFLTLFAAAGSGAAAEIRAPEAPSALNSQVVSVPGYSAETTFNAVDTQPVPSELNGQTPPASAEPLAEAAPSQPTAATLSALVAAEPVADEVSSELKCLASAIYFESRSEPLSGQLAVGRVIVNRARSGRFPSSYCGVVYQPSQFSFVHGAAMRSVDSRSRLWRNALAIAQIASDGAWQSEAEGALYFHAARVSPNWHLHRVAQIENHIFYR